MHSEINTLIESYIFTVLQHFIAVHLIRTPFFSDVKRKSMHKSEVRRIE